MTDGGLVINKDADEKSDSNYKKYGSFAVIGVLIVIVIIVVYYKADGFTSPDGVVARRSQRQVRSDTQVDRTWNLDALEKSVALLNRKSGAYS